MTAKKKLIIAFSIAGAIIVATTRPETMFGDTCIAVHPSDKKYSELIGKKVMIPLSGRQIPIIDNFKEKMGDVVNVIKVDIDQERELADKYRIQSVPTIMIFKNGEVMWRGSGLQSHTDLMVALNGVEWR